MDLPNNGEFHCDVCFGLFGENMKCPRMLTCGHSFFQSCLENLLVQSPSCPNCKLGIQFPNIDCIPVNCSVKSVVFHFNATTPGYLNEQNMVLKLGLNRDPKEESVDSLTSKKDISSKEHPYEGYCEDHHVYNRFRCMDCKCWICGDCAKLNHKPCRILVVAEALKEMKQETSREVEVEIEAQKSQNKYLDIFLKDLEGKRSSLKNEINKLQLDLRSKIETFKSFGKAMEKVQSIKHDRNKHCEKLKRLETSVEETTNNDTFLKAKNKLNEFLRQAQKLVEELTITKHNRCQLTLEILRDWCREGSVYASSCNGGVNQYGQVVVKGDRVWVHCFKPQRPQRKDVVISFRDLLITFNGSSELPRRGFIQVEDETLGLKDVVIAMDTLTPRAMNFLLLCSGIKRRSYEGVKLLGTGWGIQTPPKGGEAVFKGIKDRGVYEAPVEKGFVYGWWAKAKDSLSGFYIVMEEDPSWELTTKFGFLEEGLDLCEGINKNKSKDLFIKNCGLVI